MPNPELEQVVQSHSIDIVFPRKREISSDIAEKLLMSTIRKIECDVTYGITKGGVMHYDTQRHEYGLSMSGTILEPYSGFPIASFNMLPSGHQDLFYGISFVHAPDMTTKREFLALIDMLDKQIKKYFE